MFNNLFTYGVLVIALAYIYSRNSSKDWHGVSSPETGTIAGWKEHITPPAKRISKVAVGVNGNADLIVSATELLRTLGVDPSKGKDHDLLNSLQDLGEAFSFFFERGAAAERFFSNEKVYAKVIEAADKLPNKQYYVGGNAALSGQKIASIIPDCQVLFVGPVGPKLKRLFHERITVPTSSLAASDEVHLIMEYAKGETWGSMTTPIATRFITSNDQANGRMEKLELFADNIKEFGADMVILSGLHLLPGQSESFWKERLKDVVKEIEKIPRSIPVHLELASLADSKFMHQVMEQIFPVVNSLGLNEQELSFVSSAGNGPHQGVIESEEGFPEIGVVGDIMHWILSTYGQGKLAGSRLTRVHFHSLSFHVIANVAGTWGNSKSAVGIGTRTASQQACEETEMTAEKYSLKTPEAFALSVNSPPLRREIIMYDPMNPITTWQRDGMEFYFGPVLVCKVPGRTVGLGDSISAMGLSYSEF
ncbi:ADP-dependent glucokinase-like [Ptychodera flava]|uniref:ADP-dependent glucokinase-like n=1 Tax=Ptychodera flava TaxID=63121 RepID=UPI00396A4B2C